MAGIAPIASYPGPHDPVGEGLGLLRRRFTSLGPPQRGPTFSHRKAVIVGCGAVGMACAVSMLHRGCLEELVLVDVATERLEGEVMDLCHGMPFLPRADVRAGSIAHEGRDADLVVVTAGIAQKPGQSRLELIEANADLFRRLIPDIAEHSPRAVLLVVSNPVDLLTHIAAELSGFPHHRVIGSGTVLDSARFRMAISRRLGLDPHDVQAWVIGEHGDSEVPVWSRVQVLTVSTRVGAAEQLPEVTLSLPTVVNHTGALARLHLALSAQERRDLEGSARVLRQTLDAVGF